MSNVLDSLQPYFSHLEVNDEDKMDELNNIFQSHFIDNPLEINGKKIVVKRHIYNPKKDNLPAFYARYFEKFVHIITRTEDARRGKKRIFKEERANRIHWIKPILENRNNAKISCFKYLESDKSIREYFWYKDKGFMVVLEEVIPDYFLITGFCVDPGNYSYFQRKEQNKIA